MQRIIDLDGGVNFRDFGGYRTKEGRQLRLGRLFRCGNLADLSDRDRSRMVDLDIAVVCDLRGHDERERAPSALPEQGPRQVHIPIDPGSALSLRSKLAEDDVGLDERIEFMIGINRELAVDHVDDFRQMFDVLLGQETGGFLVHCSAGKDRTGFAAALIKLCLGVPRATVEHDYLLTNDFVDYENEVAPRLKELLGERAPSRAEALALSGVRPEYLHAAFDTIEVHFGSLETYLRDAMHIDDEKQTLLRRRFLEPS